MENMAARVDSIIKDCLYRDEEITDNKTPTDAVMVEGLVRRFGFHPGRLAQHKADIAALIAELPDTFRKSGGGGWSFLNLCMDKHGAQWGEQINCEALLVLAIATGQGGYCLPRNIWVALPGGMPYVWLGG